MKNKSVQSLVATKSRSIYSPSTRFHKRQQRSIVQADADNANGRYNNQVPATLIQLMIRNN